VSADCGTVPRSSANFAVCYDDLFDHHGW